MEALILLGASTVTALLVLQLLGNVARYARALIVGGTYHPGVITPIILGVELAATVYLWGLT